MEDEKLEGSITVKKLDRNEKPLQGAGFQLEVFNGGSWSTAVGNKETDADGIVKFEHLEPGRYRLTEIKAPQGLQPVKFFTGDHDSVRDECRRCDRDTDRLHGDER